MGDSLKPAASRKLVHPAQLGKAGLVPGASHVGKLLEPAASRALGRLVRVHRQGRLVLCLVRSRHAFHGSLGVFLHFGNLKIGLWVLGSLGPTAGQAWACRAVRSGTGRSSSARLNFDGSIPTPRWDLLYFCFPCGAWRLGLALFLLPLRGMARARPLVHEPYARVYADAYSPPATCSPVTVCMPAYNRPLFLERSALVADTATVSAAYAAALGKQESVINPLLQQVVAAVPGEANALNLQDDSLRPLCQMALLELCTSTGALTSSWRSFGTWCGSSSSSRRPASSTWSIPPRLTTGRASATPSRGRAVQCSRGRAPFASGTCSGWSR